jgi:hypothetical protein
MSDERAADELSVATVEALLAEWAPQLTRLMTLAGNPALQPDEEALGAALARGLHDVCVGGAQVALAAQWLLEEVARVQQERDAAVATRQELVTALAWNLDPVERIGIVLGLALVNWEYTEQELTESGWGPEAQRLYRAYRAARPERVPGAAVP